MSSGAEDQSTLLIADRAIVRSHGDGIGRGLLSAGGDVIRCGEGILQILLTPREESLEGVDMLRREGEVEVDRAADRAGILSPLGEVLLDGGARAIRVLMEEDQRLGQAPIAESLLRQQIADHRTPLTGIDEAACPLTSLTQHAGLIQIIVEGKVLHPIQHLLHRLCRFAPLHVGKEVAKHPRGGTAGGDKLQHPQRWVAQSRCPGLERLTSLLLREDTDTVLLICRLYDGGEGEPLLEELQLVLHLRPGDPLVADLTEILLRPLGLLHSHLSLFLYSGYLFSVRLSSPPRYKPTYFFRPAERPSLCRHG